jgi:hypothetical protein
MSKMLHDGDRIGGIEVRAKQSGDSHRKVVGEISLIGCPLRGIVLSATAARLYVLAVPRIEGQSKVEFHALHCSFTAGLL